MRKFFRVATEGATTDGRTISRQWIRQMADSYDRAKFGARVWVEHLRSLLPDGPFRAFGDITRLDAREVEDGKLALFAEIDPTDDLLQINARRQKIYTSIEVDPEFADTGEAYMVALAVTDSPASLGTEMLRFCAAQGAKSPLAAKKLRPENLFTEAVAIDLDFSDAEPDDQGPTLLDQVKDLFAKYRDSGKDKLAAFRDDLSEALGEIVEKIAALEDRVDPKFAADTGNRIGELQTEIESLSRRVDAIEHTEAAPPRPPALGGDGEQRAQF